MIYTTLNRIQERGPCSEGWDSLLRHLNKTAADDEPVPLLTVLEANGLDDALQCLRAEPQHASLWRMYAVRCARRVQHLMTDPSSLEALDVAERHAMGKATDDELAIAAGDALAATWAVREARDAALDATGEDAAWAVRATWAAVRDATWAAGDATWDAPLTEMSSDFRALLTAHEAQPGESCDLVMWWELGGQQ